MRVKMNFAICTLRSSQILKRESTNDLKLKKGGIE
jgi:hypothetical protein